MKTTIEEYREIINLSNKLGLEKADLYNALNDRDVDDFEIGDYRFISDEEIWDIYVEAIKDIAINCYELDLPDWLAVDWEKTADNCHQDGYGHTFASYDGGEKEISLGGVDYWYFRVN